MVKVPNNYVDNKQYWDDLSDIDFITAFVKAWLAFNAWYRSHYNLTQDRQILEQVKFHPNPIKNKAESMLKPKDRGRNRGVSAEKRFRLDQESQELRSNISLLHDRLEKHPLLPFDKKKASYEKISFTNVFLKRKTPISLSECYSGLEYSVAVTLNGGSIQSILATITHVKNGSRKFSHSQDKYDARDLATVLNTSKLNPQQTIRMKNLYANINPEVYANLMTFSEDEIECDAYVFRCSSEDLFAGTIEILYAMRCMLFHGELVPSRDAKLCYEPAYRILKHFLSLV